MLKYSLFRYSTYIGKGIMKIIEQKLENKKQREWNRPQPHVEIQ